MVFPVVGMKKKKKRAKCRGAGLLPISSLCESRYSGLYCDTGGTGPGRLSYDTAGLSHDTAKRKAAIRPRVDTTRPATGCDTVGAWPRHSPAHGMSVRPERTARNLGAPCAQQGSVGCASVHPTQFWTQCTVSESLFGILFMNTVHKICLKKKL